jgi:hypothetical protein
MTKSLAPRFSVEFMNFPHDFDKSENFFLDLLQYCVSLGKISAEDLTEQKILFSGCYPEVSLLNQLFTRAKAHFSVSAMQNWLEFKHGLNQKTHLRDRSIWCTFENRRPITNGYQRTLSFDLDDFDGTNFYLPLWAYYIDLFGTGGKWIKHRVSQSQLRKGRPSSDFKPRSKFACAFINNPEPMRIRAIEELSSIGEIDIFGRYADNYVADKISVSQQYRFAICFENDLYPGYVTEKPLEAWIAGSIPLYWGNDSGKYLNPEAIVNLHNIGNLRQFVNLVASIDRSETLQRAMFCQPLLSKEIDIEALCQFTSTWLDR